jgi:hypothetical protein
MFAAEAWVVERAVLTTTGLTRQSRGQSKAYITAETLSSQSSEYFLIKNSLLRVLRGEFLLVKI